MTIRSLRAFKQKSDYIKILKFAPIPLQVLLPLPKRNGLSKDRFCFFYIKRIKLIAEGLKKSVKKTVRRTVFRESVDEYCGCE